MDTLLLNTLIAAMDEKPAHLAKFLTQAGDDAHQRTRRLDFALQTAAQGLADMADRGHIDAELLLPALAEPLRQGTGNVGVAGALAGLVPAEAQDLLDLLLDHPEGALRSAAMEILGGRKDPAFRPALLKLRRDAISDIANRSLWHLGQLPDPARTARTLLDQSDPAEVVVGLQFISMHKLAELKSPELCMVAVEAFARAHGEPDRPLPSSASQSLLTMTRGGWSARNPWPFRLRTGRGHDRTYDIDLAPVWICI